MQTMTTEYPGTMVLCYEQSEGGKPGLMKNVNIRKAISYSINRERWYQLFTEDTPQLTASFPRRSRSTELPTASRRRRP